MTCNWSSALKMVSRTLRMKAESSTTSTRNFLLGLGAIADLRHRYRLVVCLRSHKLFDRCNQLIFLYGLGQKCHGAFLDGAVAMLCAGARGDHHDRNTARRGTLAQLHHELV